MKTATEPAEALRRTRDQAAIDAPPLEFPARAVLADDSPVSAYYASFAPLMPPTEALRGDHRADAVVVGGGFTGLSTALHLAERGVATVVLEAKEIGWGASGRAFGQVVPYFKHNPAHVLAHYGPERGERMLEATGNGPDLVFSLIEKHRIECAPVRHGLIFAAHSPAGEAGLEKRTAYWQQRGAPIEMLGPEETGALIGTRYYRSCSLDRRGGTINPLAYARGLARAAIAAGATIYAGSPATTVRRGDDGWKVITANGSVTAGHVVLATNAHTTNRLWPGLADSIIPLRGHQFVSRPLSDALRRRILPERQSMTDTRHLFSGLRMHADGRLHASADGPVFDGSGKANMAKLDKRLRALFPEAGPFEWEHRWSGWVAMTYDQYPHLHELAPGLLAAFACSGRGIVHATMMGRDLAGRIAGVPADELVFPVTTLAPRRMTRYARVPIGALLVYYRMQDALDDLRFHKEPARG